jgi:hypothetical protein
MKGLSEGDAYVIRNAGGRAPDNAIRSNRETSRSGLYLRRRIRAPDRGTGGHGSRIGTVADITAPDRSSGGDFVGVVVVMFEGLVRTR